MGYILHLLIFICFYTLPAQSLNLSAGLTGLISLAHAGFYGIGAYTTAILSQQFGMPFWINLPVAMLVCVGVSLLVSLIALRTVDDYFIICTLVYIILILFLIWKPLGFSGVRLRKVEI